MYSDNTFDNLFTGYESGGEYIYPTAAQNLAITFSGFYLSALDGDFSTDPVTITSETGEAEDITIGNAPAKVLTAQMLNPFGTMESLTWGDGTVYIGCVTSSATADTYSSLPCHVYVNSIHYGINASGNARRGSTTYTLGGTPMAVIANSTGTDVLFITDTKIGRYNGSFSVVSTPTDAQAFMAAKCRQYADPMGIALDANGCPAVFNDVTASTKTTYGYVPMGVFDFSNVDAYGITFGVEAYDKMTLFDADATDWVNNLDFTTPKTLSTLISELMTEMGLTCTVDASAVNTSVTWSENPITNYAVTYRQVLKWLAEAIGCNVRMSRTGTVEFVAFHSTPVGNTITLDTIVGNSRTKGRYTVPVVTKVICYNTVGAGYEDGTSGSDYYVVANPFIDPSGGLAPVTALLGLIDDIPAYYPTAVVNAYSDPRIDAGDFVTVTDMDGNTTFNVPVMHQTLQWNGMCTTQYVADGRQVRTVPDSLEGTGLSEVVSTNPAAVVNMIMAKGITVYDSNNNVLFSAIGDNHLVEIAGFNVDKNQIIYDDALKTIKMNNSTGFSVKKKSTQQSAFLDDGIVSVGDESIAENPYGALHPQKLNFGALTHYKTAEYARGGFDIWENNVGEATLDLTNGLHIDDTTNNIDITPTNIAFSGGLSSTTITPSSVTTAYGAYTASLTHTAMTVADAYSTTTQNASGFSAVNGSYSVTMDAYGASAVYGSSSVSINSTGVTFADGTATPTMRVIRRSLNAAGSTTVTLEDGLYIAVVTHQNNSSTNESGLYIIQCNNTSSIRAISTAQNQTLSVSGHTLTWTTTNTYRQLRLIYIS